MTDALPDLDALEAAANAATPGPWAMARNSTSGPWFVASNFYNDEEPVICGEFSYNWPLTEEDARHISACSPDVVLRLVGENRRLRSLVRSSYLEGHAAGWEYGAGNEVPTMTPEDEAEGDWLLSRSSESLEGEGL